MGIEFEDTIHIQPEVSGGGTPVDAYTKEETDTLLDNRIEPIEEVIPSNASSSNQLVTASDIDGFSNKGLSNLDTNGNNRLHALKGYEDNGELLTDAEGLADVQSYARSTFDRSKFNVVGNPNITDDGIASGFRSSAYLKFNTLSVNNKPFTIRIKANASEFVNNCFLFCTNVSLASSPKLWLYCDINGRPILMWDNGNGQKTIDTFPVLFLNTNYLFEFGQRADYSFFLKVINLDTNTLVNELTKADTQFYTSDFTNFYLSKGDNFYWHGSIDLKQFSITIDGVEVFSGNKTGIDTIKSDNYTVVGSPTITDDGIIIQSSGNYIYTTGINLNANSFRIKTKINITTVLPVTTRILQYNNGLIVQQYGSVIQLLASSVGDGSTWDIANWVASSNNTLSVGIHDLEVEFTGSQYLIKLNGITKITVNSTDKIATQTRFYLFNGNNTLFVGGGQDLNSFKIYVDGNLVYQPCLKIPYTESKTGSKIVQSAYRDRVEDMYEQFGYAPYYTLSDTDFTLPQGEIYGMIERKADISDIPDIPDISGLATKTELADGLSTKQDVLTAGDGLDIKMINPDAVENTYYRSNGLASGTTQLTEQQAISVTLTSSAQKFGTFAQGIDTTRSLDIEVVLPLTWTSDTTYRKCISNSDNNMGGNYSNGAIRVLNTYGSNAIQFQYGRANSNYNNLGTFTLTDSSAPQLYVKLSKTNGATPTFTIYAKENSTDDYTVVGTVTYNASTFPYGLATDRYILVVMDSGTDTFNLTLNSVVYTPARDSYLEISTVNKVSSTGVATIVTTTSTEYGSLTPDSSTLYLLTDTGAIYLGTTLIAQKNT